MGTHFIATEINYTSLLKNCFHISICLRNKRADVFITPTFYDGICLAFHLYLALKATFGIFFFFLFAQKKETKKRALLPAAPTTCGDCADFDGAWIVFRYIVLYSSPDVKSGRFPPTSGTIPFGRACLAEGTRSAWPNAFIVGYYR
jgi:hypothetical protein